MTKNEYYERSFSRGKKNHTIALHLKICGKTYVSFPPQCRSMTLLLKRLIRGSIKHFRKTDLHTKGQFIKFHIHLSCYSANVVITLMSRSLSVLTSQASTIKAHRKKIQFSKCIHMYCSTLVPSHTVC